MKIAVTLCVIQLARVILAFNSTADRLPLHAMLGMVLGLYIIWVIFFGFISYKCRDWCRAVFQKLPGSWPLKFFIFASILALTEEAVTVAMTNTAPWYGLRLGEAYITASANYLDVILGSSVIVILPMIAAWTWLLWKYKFTPNQTLILFGLSGTIAESLSGGPGHFIEIGMWLFVYGLMIYLPAYCVPSERPAKRVSFWAVLLAIFLPVMLAIASIPLVSVVNELRPSTLVKFPPIVI